MRINPRQMEKMMKQMGMQTTQISADEVIIKRSDGGEIIIRDPEVSKIKMMGQESFQITGTVEERQEPEFSEDDIMMVSEQAGVSKEEALKALEEFGDIAGAILHLKK
ncbi:MAG: nascent polypeptide-associated complex protein [Candidatus Micrarchaeota archaeon]|nr:nascent polypeptide-associated complex protein [Candidatus Micrarchaeota archaeon]